MIFICFIFAVAVFVSVPYCLVLLSYCPIVRKGIKGASRNPTYSLPDSMGFVICAKQYLDLPLFFA